MKKTLKYLCLLAIITSVMMSACKRDADYIKGTPSPFISNFDLKKQYKEADLLLNTDIMLGANSIKGVVISDYSSGNAPNGLLVIQNSRMVGSGIDSVRGMAVNIGADAVKYAIGDSVHIKVEGGTLKRVNGILQITGLSSAAVNKVASGKSIKVPIVSSAQLLAAPGTYENTLITMSNTVLEPEPAQGETYVGDKTINDGFGIATLHTEATANFASQQLPPSANFTGVIYYNNQRKPQLWIRNIDDAFELPLIKPSPVIITGYLPDPQGTDASTSAQYEYIQFMATKDIDFAVTPFSVVTNNNAGAATYPTLGWATGGVRTYKINLTSGTVRKGEFFYVGGSSKLIWGAGSTNVSNAKWIAAVNYASNNGADFGTANTNLLANSGNPAGIAVFEGTTVTASSVPLDVMMYGGSTPISGMVYSAGPPEVGYRITNTDFYSTINASTRKPQPIYGGGSNTTRLSFQATQSNPTGGSFVRLGGIYNPATGRWKTGRSLRNITMSLTMQLSELETGVGITTLEN
ncbi:DUF5689 domain-containing protein [Pedobacter montanisoli]|uniref:DUF5689 domain-containing protein n=1 Tax=Pedobacter montanisoli TaxID=2923277 RepID=A0ABS9ZY05_9SPHI|nr:DUF5689 domain-containing protein [Pedobacter montanisoli]MCJ0743180.1 DUF5689 domain-containing protein [Pedobacter montanisoli]